MYFLANALGQPLSVIRAMSIEEFEGWMAFKKMEADANKPAQGGDD